MNLDTLDINVVIAGSRYGKTRLLCKVASMEYGKKVVLFITTGNTTRSILAAIGDVETCIHVFEVAVGSSMFSLYNILFNFKGDIDLLIVDYVEHFTHQADNSVQSKLQGLSDVKKELGCDVWTSLNVRRGN